jgi:3-hydroxyacyl-CoA dehydrogenase/enoyl-CoA hydratase/3-hydroxybutyryl-CoA epimerase
MGPFALADVTGIDVGYKVIQELERAFAPRLQAAPVLDRFIQKGLLGKKSGGGFYRYEGKERAPNSDAVKLLEGFQKQDVADSEIIDRLILSMLNEAAMCLQEGIVERGDYLDMALIAGIGFPPFRGGLLRYADERGLASIGKRLAELQASGGERFKPCGLLQKMAEDGTTFYGG